MAITSRQNIYCELHQKYTWRPLLRSCSLCQPIYFNCGTKDIPLQYDKDDTFKITLNFFKSIHLIYLYLKFELNRSFQKKIWSIKQFAFFYKKQISNPQSSWHQMAKVIWTQKKTSMRFSMYRLFCLYTTLKCYHSTLHMISSTYS